MAKVKEVNQLTLDMRIRSSGLFFTIMVFSVSIAFGQNANHYNIKKKVAMGGYDAVSYFNNKPEQGSTEYSVTHEGVTYSFASPTNKSKFEKSPSSYIPQYGGWCAYAMGANGDKVKVDPETYKIVSGKLYLFYNFYFTNTLDSWNEDEAGLKNTADNNWSKIIN